MSVTVPLDIEDNVHGGVGVVGATAVVPPMDHPFEVDQLPLPVRLHFVRVHNRLYLRK